MIRAWIWVSLAWIAQTTAAAPRPNVLYLLADDLGYADVSFNGKDIQTPNIDSIAKAGAKLERFYVQPVCSPTRAALMTGRYPMRLGLQVGVVRPWAQYGLPLEERTLPQALKEAGYETAIVGKWHLGHYRPEYLPTHRGFDHQYGHYNGALDYFTHIRDGGFDWHRDDKVNHDQGYTTHLDAKEAVRLIENRDKNKPLFLYVPFNAVHAPHQVPEKYKEPYAALAEPRRTYAGMVAAMDEAIGQILAAVDRQGMRENTLIIFHSDNGGPQPGKVTSNGELRAGKGTLYEGGVRAAACAAWAGHIAAGSSVKQVIHTVDMYATLLSLAGASLEQRLPIDGRDAWQAISGGNAAAREPVVLNTTPNNGAILAGDWKLVINGQIQANEGEDGDEALPVARGNRGGRRRAATERVELFDLSRDLSEKNNLAATNPQKVKELRAIYDKFAAEAVPPKNKPKAPDFKTPKVWGE
jgi:arylsulfatase A-like enzyme